MILLKSRRHQWMKPNSSKRHGATTVEFAFASAILFLLIFAAIEFTRISMVRHAVDSASYEAARHVVVPGANVSEAEDIANEILQRMSIQGATITVTPNPILESSTEVQVTVDVPMDGNGWGVDVFGKNIELASTTTLHTERSPLALAPKPPKPPKPRR